MEEKKFDSKSIIGFALIAALMIWMLYANAPSQEEIDAEKARTEQLAKEEAKQEEQNVVEPAGITSTNDFSNHQAQDSLAQSRMQNELGSFAYSAGLSSATENETVLENDNLYLKVNNKGGQITEVRIKDEVNYQDEPIYLIKDHNASLALQFTSENRILNTTDLYFEPELINTGDSQILTMRLKASEDRYLEYRYELPKDSYMMDFSIRTVGMGGMLNTNQPITLDWQLKGMRQAKSIAYENRYTRLVYEYEGKKHNKLSAGSDADKVAKDVSWMNYRQHFFSSLLLTDTPFSEVRFDSKNLAKDEEIDTIYTKKYRAEMALEARGGELNYNMNMYYGPTDYKIFKKYGRNLDNAMPLGWGIFGVINKYIFIPVFGWLSSFLPAGIAIIVLTIIVKIALSPVQYKQFVSQAKMRVLRPEMEAIKAKYEGNQMKIQQETMKLQNAAGASPLKGCLPALLQLPVFYSLFTFFPTAYDLRGKGFLWADDLSSYDSIYDLPFYIPLYGDHISLFPILASIAIFIYMMMTMGQNLQSQPQQPGMPNMKFMMYLSPLMMLIFFNNYASGLSLYYFVSNLLTIGIMLVIKHVIIDEDKIHASVQVSKSKPKKQNKFQRKMASIMEQAEEQKRIQEANKGKKK